MNESAADASGTELSADQPPQLHAPFEPNAEPKLDEAERFFRILDRDATDFTFRILPEKDTAHTRVVLPRVLSGRLANLAPLFAAENAVGGAIFVNINETDLSGGAKRNIVRVRAVWVDIDKDPIGTRRQALKDCPLPPHMIVESSPGKTHAYWLVGDMDLSVHVPTLYSLVERFGGDYGACDVARILRLPGFRNHKGQGWTHIIHVNDVPAYSAQQIYAEFPPRARSERPRTTSPRLIDNCTAHDACVSVDAETIFRLRSALNAIRSDDRDLWIRMGCALRELGDVGRGIWLDWSATSTVHRPDEDARTWDGLGHDRTGYGAVFAEAQRRGWVNPRSNQTAASVSPGASRIVTITADALLNHDFPPRQLLLSPWLESQSLSMIYASRGVGKTHVALAIAYALATGGYFLGWRAPTPVSVLYLDGEMPGVALRDRLAHLVRSNEISVADGRLTFVTPDLQENGVMPNLADKAGQDAIEAIIGDAKVIIVDNLSCWVRSGKENEAEGWQPIAAWSLRMRALGRSVIFIHHAGKGGQQRGTSKREDLLDTVINLKRPSDYRAEQGARFEVHFEKARALFGKDVSPVEVMLQTDTAGKQSWASKSVDDAIISRMIEMANLDLSQTEIAKELGCDKSTVSRNLRKAADEGRYTPPKERQQRPKRIHGREPVETIDSVLRVAPTSACNTQHTINGNKVKS